MSFPFTLHNLLSNDTKKPLQKGAPICIIRSTTPDKARQAIAPQTVGLLVSKALKI